MKNFLLFFFITMTILGYSQDPIQKKSYQTKKLTNGPIIIDGIMDDESWNLVEWGGNFIQQRPYEGKQPSQPTYFKILYDDDNLYVGVLNYDSVPSEIDRRMCRRDDFEGDFIEINIDSYNDQMTAFSFTLNAAGVRGDEAITEDGDEWDETWDPIWYGKTTMVDSGWVAEIKIPFTQLRFGKKANHSWGMQFTRRIYRNEERSLWQFTPRDANGWVHHFGTLEGINNISPKRQIDVFPYVVAKQEYLEKEEGNPYATGKKSTLSGGIDGKVGITNDLTLDFTINPDFGQVEADPSEVNLTAFESYFDEKRPFFIEGNNILNFQINGGGNSMARDNLFYSRRIGRLPHYYPNLNDGEYADFPEYTTILGAFKLTGKTKNGWSIGVMESITPRENAEIDLKGEKRKEEVEPFTNYFVGRVQKDINKGNTVIGGIFTSTNRKITNGEIDFLPRSAYTGGIDFTQFWKNKAYYIRLKAVVSKVNADSIAMTNIQRSSVHYFQRPDADYIHVDSSRTSLTGQGGTVQFGKAGEGHIRYVAWVTWRSPGLELNDVGFLRSGDEVFQVFWMQYGIWEPFSIFREMRINYNQWTTWDFGGRNNSFGTNVNMNMDFKNHWSFNCGVNYNGEYLSKSFLRGGPSMKKPADWNTWGWLGTDRRKKIRLSFNYSINKNFHNAGEFNFYNAHVTYRPNDAIKITAGPFYSDITPTLQYVTDTCDYNNEQRYIISRMHQSTFGLSMRLEYYITPDLSVQYYGQPFISAGNYTEFKRITNPVADDFFDRYHQFTDEEISYDAENDTYEIDENHDHTTDYSFSNPNFNFMQFRSNLVVRWEYLPGSTAYFVWSQGRTMSNDEGDFSFNNNMEDLFDTRPHNIFLLKVSYRLQL